MTSCDCHTNCSSFLLALMSNTAIAGSAGGGEVLLADYKEHHTDTTVSVPHCGLERSFHSGRPSGVKHFAASIPRALVKPRWLFASCWAHVSHPCSLALLLPLASSACSFPCSPCWPGLLADGLVFAAPASSFRSSAWTWSPPRWRALFLLHAPYPFHLLLPFDLLPCWLIALFLPPLPAPSGPLQPGRSSL